MATLNEKLMCTVLNIQVDMERHVAHIRVAEGQCTDMAGVIEVVTGLDPDVKIIQTASGHTLDTRYEIVEGEWKATLGRGVQNAVRQ